MKILFVSVEVAPFAKVGGLADVAGSLPQALRALGHDVRVVMPAYQMILDNPEFEVRAIKEDQRIEINPQWVKWGTVYQTDFNGLPTYLLGTDEWFNTATSSETVYQAGVDQYLFFSKAVLELTKELDWMPDVIHANDWHTGMIPVLLREQNGFQWNETASVFSIHNLAYQGEFPVEVLDKLGLPRHLFNMHQLETWGSVNFLKAGCVYSDQVNTVSPHYAEEIQTPEFGCRLEGLMAHLAKMQRLSGILNGIDTTFFNPETDPHLLGNTFGPDSLDGKNRVKHALLAEVGLEPVDGAPLVGVVSRLSSQKGMDLMLTAAEQMFELPVQMIVQGLGDVWLAEKFAELEKQYPKHFRFVQRFDAALAQRIYGGSDLFLMPSSFEPCGLGQMIALRYGTIPVVRSTGGLADTVFEGQNGFVFLDRDTGAMVRAVERAAEAYKKKDWAKLVRKAMKGDYGWSSSAKKYLAMYEKALARRQFHEPAASLTS